MAHEPNDDGPVEGASVTASLAGVDVATASTGPDGAYALPGLPAADGYTVTVADPRFVDESRAGAEVVAANATTVDFLLTPARGDLRGFVGGGPSLDRLKPLAGIRVFARVDGAPEAVTDPEGRFRIDDLPAGRPIVVVADGLGRGFGRVSMAVVVAGQTSLDYGTNFLITSLEFPTGGPVGNPNDPVRGFPTTGNDLDYFIDVDGGPTFEPAGDPIRNPDGSIDIPLPPDISGNDFGITGQDPGGSIGGTDPDFARADGGPPVGAVSGPEITGEAEATLTLDASDDSGLVRARIERLDGGVWVLDQELDLGGTTGQRGPTDATLPFTVTLAPGDNSFRSRIEDAAEREDVTDVHTVRRDVAPPEIVEIDPREPPLETNEPLTIFVRAEDDSAVAFIQLLRSESATGPFEVVGEAPGGRRSS